MTTLQSKVCYIFVGTDYDSLILSDLENLSDNAIDKLIFKGS